MIVTREEALQRAAEVLVDIAVRVETDRLLAESAEPVESKAVA